MSANDQKDEGDQSDSDSEVIDKKLVEKLKKENQELVANINQKNDDLKLAAKYGNELMSKIEQLNHKIEEQNFHITQIDKDRERTAKQRNLSDKNRQKRHQNAIDQIQKDHKIISEEKKSIGQSES